MPFLARRPRLLLLDDDPSMQRLVTAVLKKKGYRIDVVSAGDQAIEKVKAAAYDALLLDVMTPTEGGLTVIYHLRKVKPDMLKRVILITASPQSVLHAVEGEVFDIIRKPFEPATLVSTVARLLKKPV